MSDGTGSTPHDSLFKLAFSDAASGAALLRVLLPEALTRRVAWSTLKLRSGSFKDRDLAGLESDLIFSAAVDGREVLFYFLVEHQSTVDPTMAWRLWRYLTGDGDFDVDYYLTRLEDRAAVVGAQGPA